MKLLTVANKALAFKKCFIRRANTSSGGRLSGKHGGGGTHLLLTLVEGELALNIVSCESGSPTED